MLTPYDNLVADVLLYGEHREARNADTLAIFGKHIHFDLQKGFPIVTKRKIAYKQAFGELAAFIRGATTNEEFVKLGCNYWSAYGNELGPIYGAQWRNFGPSGKDQLFELVQSLETNPTSRRHLLITWNPNDNDNMVLPPCHLLAQFYVNNLKELSCIVYMRSVDVMLGLPYDLIVYATLTHLLAKDLGLTPKILKFFLGDVHIYTDHLKGAREYLSRDDQFTLPEFCFTDSYSSLFNFKPGDVALDIYGCHPEIKFELLI